MIACIFDTGIYTGYAGILFVGRRRKYAGKVTGK